MEQTSKSNEMRPAVRLLIGIFATSMLFIGLPILVTMPLPVVLGIFGCMRFWY